jgi:hypothetical protein
MKIRLELKTNKLNYYNRELDYYKLSQVIATKFFIFRGLCG